MRHGERKARRQAARERRRPGAISPCVVLSLLALLAFAWPGPALGQQRSATASGIAGDVRVVERFDPGDSRRSYRLVRPLTPGERRSVEGALRRVGMHLPRVDGVFDEATRRALERFQRREGLDPCRCVDYETATALGLETRVVLTELVSAGTTAGSPPARERVDVFYPATPTPERRTESGAEGAGADGRAGRVGGAGDRSVRDRRVHDRDLHDRDIHGHGLHGHGFHAHLPFFFPAGGPDALEGVPGQGASGSRGGRGRPGAGPSSRVRVLPGPLFGRPLPAPRVPFPGSRARPR